MKPLDSLDKKIRDKKKLIEDLKRFIRDRGNEEVKLDEIDIELLKRELNKEEQQ